MEKVEPFECYALGLVCASVCTSLTNEEAARRLNALHPTGISSGWEVAEDATFADGETPNPAPCPDVEGHRHVLFEC